MNYDPPKIVTYNSDGLTTAPTTVRGLWLNEGRLVHRLPEGSTWNMVGAALLLAMPLAYADFLLYAGRTKYYPFFWYRFGLASVGRTEPVSSEPAYFAGMLKAWAVGSPPYYPAQGNTVTYNSPNTPWRYCMGDWAIRGTTANGTLLSGWSTDTNYSFPMVWVPDSYAYADYWFWKVGFVMARKSASALTLRYTQGAFNSAPSSANYRYLHDVVAELDGCIPKLLTSTGSAVKETDLTRQESTYGNLDSVWFELATQPHNGYSVLAYSVAKLA